MAQFKVSGILTDINPLETNTVQMHDLGQEARVVDGRVFRYAQAGAVAITAGKLQLGPAPKTNHHNIVAASAASAGDTEITLTLGATAAVADEYAEGYLIASDVAPEGIALKISGHPAASASASLTLKLYDKLPEAVTTSSEFTLVHNTYNGVVEATTQTQVPAGVPLVDMAISAYGWLQTKGIAPVLADETITLGSWVTIGSSTAGAVEDMDDVSAPLTEWALGWAIVAGVDTEFRPIFLTID